MHREHEAELQISNSSLNRRYINVNISNLRKYSVKQQQCTLSSINPSRLLTHLFILILR